MNNELISKRAYELYVRRGCKDGFDVDDWLQAEREIQMGSYQPKIDLSTASVSTRRPASTTGTITSTVTRKKK